MSESPASIWPAGIPDRPVSRIAPTPSGFLHLGNAVNFLVTWAIVRCLAGTLHLRIDDMDGIRFREDVLEDIFTSLDWLGVDWDKGPAGPESFCRHYSLQLRRDYYREKLTALARETGKVFACRCSRSTIKKNSPTGLYPGTCREAGLEFLPGGHALRLRVDEGASVNVGHHEVAVDREFGDFVLWRKDDQPSYQLASLLEDEGAGMTFIVRGEDLLFSTAAQLYLARCFKFTAFPACSFIHHSLIPGSDGKKLSKSRGAYALKDVRESGGGPEAAVRAAAAFLEISGEGLASAADLKSRLGEVWRSRGWW